MSLPISTLTTEHVAQKIVIPWVQTSLVVGTVLQDLCYLKKGTRILDCALLVVTIAVSGSGTVEAEVVTNEVAEEVIIGDDPIDLETLGSPSYTTIDTATDGATDVVTARKAMADDRLLLLRIICATADATVPAAGVVIVDLARRDNTSE